VIATRKPTPKVRRLAQRIMRQADLLAKQGLRRSHVNAAPSIRVLVCQLCEVAGLPLDWGAHYAAWSDSKEEVAPDGQHQAQRRRPLRLR
jgi:hypothetical protein